MAEREMSNVTRFGGPAGTTGTLAGGALAGLAAMALGWVIGFLIGMVAGHSLGEGHGVYTGLQERR